jgi:hypothetical protein
MLIHNHANVFSRTSLDIGARFMLDNLPIHSARKVIDLGCGNGVLGLSLLARDAEVEVTFIDESTWRSPRPSSTSTQSAGCPAPRPLLVNNCLDGVAVGSVDGSSATAVPPVAGDHRPYRLADVQRCPPGVAQGRRTLDSRQPSPGLSQQLKRLFGNAQVVASNSKFVILKAIKR